MSKFKIIVFPVPASGHVIPMLPILNQLSKEKNIEIIVYTIERYRSNFEAVGAEVRPLINYDDSEKIQPAERKRKFVGFKVVQFFTQFASRSSVFIANEISKENPDLIIYDVMSIYLKWALIYYNKWYDIARESTPEQRAKLEFCPTNKAPPLVCSSPSFCGSDKIYPNKVEFSLIAPSFLSFTFIFGFIMCVIENLKLCFSLKLGFINPFKHIIPRPFLNTKFVMVTVFPELQPRAHLFDRKMYKFIGSTIDEKVKNEFSNKNHDALSDILKMKISQGNNKHEEKLKLIYVSLGSIFNNNIDLYKIIINGMKKINMNEEEIKVVVSTGDLVYEKFSDLISKRMYSLPNNFTLVRSVPQVEILKRASLFVTHSGQNSVSESIHYGGDFFLLKHEKFLS